MNFRLLLWGMVAVLAAVMLAYRWLSPQQVVPPAADDQELAISAPNDPEMQSAYDKARRTLNYFLGVAKAPPPDTRGFALKVGVVERDQTEFFWVYPFEWDDEGFSGRINVEPELVNSVFKGQIIEFQRSQIVDWTFEDRATNIMHGNYTGCVQLKREAPEHAEQFQNLYGLNCDK